MSSHSLRLLLFAVWTFYLSCSHACSIYVPEYAGFDPQEYVFYGEITGHVSAPVTFCGMYEKQPCEDAWGWKLQVVKSVSMPGVALKEIELFTFGLGADCSAPGRSRESAEKTPIGTRLMVIAKPWRRNPASGTVRLDGSGYLGATLIPIPANADVATLADEEMRYRGLPKGRAAQIQLRFELRKDMARLEQDSSPDSRKKILARLANAWWFAEKREGDESDHAFRTAVRRYGGDEASIQWLFKQRQSFFYAAGQFGTEEALAYELERANEGSAEYQFYAGVNLAQSDSVKAIPWLQKASRARFAAADLWLGRTYEELSSQAPPAKAATYQRLARASYRQAALRGRQLASRGDSWAQVMLVSRPHELYPWLGPFRPDRIDSDRVDSENCKAGGEVSDGYLRLFSDIYAYCRKYIDSDLSFRRN